MNKRISIRLTDEEYKFIMFMSQRDNLSMNDEMFTIFQVELDQEMNLYEFEFNEWKEENGIV